MAERFDPQRDEPEKWLDAAANADFTQALLTTMPDDFYELCATLAEVPH